MGAEAGGLKGKGKDIHAEAVPGSWFGPKRDSPRQKPTQGLSSPSMPESKGPKNVTEWLGLSEPQSARPKEQHSEENKGKGRVVSLTHTVQQMHGWNKEVSPKDQESKVRAKGRRPCQEGERASTCMPSSRIKC